MEPQRKKSIDNLVNELKSKYDVKSFEGLKQLAKDKEINVIESDEVIISKAILFENGQKYILLRENSLGKPFTFGHELGHLLLGHLGNKMPSKEKEADYFSEQLLNKRESFLNLEINAICKIIENPFLSFKYAFFSNLDNKHCLNIIKNYKQQNVKT